MKRVFIQFFVLAISAFMEASALAQLSTATPQQLREAQLKISNKDFSFSCPTDLVVVSGTTTIKDGAWQKLRFRDGGRYSAWHKNHIVYEGQWAVVGDHTLRLTDHKPEGMILVFDASFSSYKVTNLPNRTGKAMGRAPELSAFVGRWRWSVGGVINYFREDGRAFTEVARGKPGQWKEIAPGKIEINWDHGVYIDTMRLTAKGKQLKGRNQLGLKLEATRLNDPRF